MIQNTATLPPPQAEGEIERIVDRIDALFYKASPGQWIRREPPPGYSSVAIVQAPRASSSHAYDIEVLGEDDTLYPTRDGDVDFIVAVKNAWPAIAAALRSAQAPERERKSAEDEHIEDGSDTIDMTVPRPFYTRALQALNAAHNACFDHENRDLAGMSHGPFAGVNVALGVVCRLERERESALTEIAELKNTIDALRARTYADGIEDAAKQCALRADELAFDAGNPDHSRNHREYCHEASVELAMTAVAIRSLATKPAGKEP